MSRAAAETLFGAALEASPAFARALDRADPLAAFRGRFDLPVGPDGDTVAYLVGNSLGPVPAGTRDALSRETERWARFGVDGWFEKPEPWYEADERFLPALGSLVGASPSEVAVMNGLSVNLHLMLASFYRPDGARRRILIERPCFPSDRFVVETHLRWHGLDPAAELLEVGPRAGRATLEEEDIEAVLAERGQEIALVLVGGVNFLTGQVVDMERIARAARRAGSVIGLDLAHAVGNVPLRLHEWDVDFAAWCHYKYVNAGPGAPAGAFVHERHAGDRMLRRLGGWWGNDPRTRFRMQLDPDFVARPDAAGWQISCPPVLALAPLGPALSLLEKAGLERLRTKSVRLTALLEWLIVGSLGDAAQILTPSDPARRGAQLSLRIPGDVGDVQVALQAAGVVGDFRQPDVLRLAPAPLFNTFHEVWRAANALKTILTEDGET